MLGTRQRWILAFDGSCTKCQAISNAVAQASSEKLEVLPLTHPDVLRWREQCLGENAPWVPTLIQIDGIRVRAWTGTVMAFRLVRALGLRSTMRVLRALGELRQQQSDPTQDRADRQTIGRKRFLQLGAGIAVAAGLTIAGKGPAFAQSATSRARSWAEANQKQLPQHYAAVVQYPVEYRRAIFAKSSPQVRSALWLEHLRSYQTIHPHLSSAQIQVIDRAAATFADEAIFEKGPSTDVDRRLTSLREAAVAAFGETEASALLATLGPVEQTEPSAALVPDCECSTSSDWCGSYCFVPNPPCPGWIGCGSGWIYWCNGYCR